MDINEGRFVSLRFIDDADYSNELAAMASIKERTKGLDTRAARSNSQKTPVGFLYPTFNH